MNVPEKILVRIDEMQAPYAVISQVESAVMNYMRRGMLPVGLSSMAAGLFEQLRAEIDAIMKRRRKAAEYRRRRKEAMLGGVQQTRPEPKPVKKADKAKPDEKEPSPDKSQKERSKKPFTSVSDYVFDNSCGMEGLTRQQIRSIERVQKLIKLREQQTADRRLNKNLQVYRYDNLYDHCS